MPKRETRGSLNPIVALGERKVGPTQPVFIIAEIGVNHNGDIRLAKKLIDQAAACGADCAKFQTFRTEEFMADRRMVYEYVSGGRRTRENMFDMFKRLELPLAWHERLFEHCRKRGLMPLTSVADAVSAEAVDRLGIEAFKLSSEDLINLPLLECVAKKRKPLILSTGMADEEEVDDALRILGRHDCRDVVFLHCVSVYPTPSDEANLLRMRALAEKVGGVVGYSDHTLGITAAVAAVALGACVIEKHFTLDRGMPGPDHGLSSGPDEFAAMVAAVRDAEKMLGKKRLEPSSTERKTRLQFRRSIVASRDMPKGHVLSSRDIALKRPGTGLRARALGTVLGRRLIRAVAKDQQITYQTLSRSR